MERAKLLNSITESTGFLNGVTISEDGSIDAGFNGYYETNYTFTELYISIVALHNSGDTYDQMTYSGSWNAETQSFNGVASRIFRQWCSDSRMQLSVESTFSGASAILE